MYEAFFNLNCRPFDLAPDPNFLHLTRQHSRAVANLRFALLNHDSFVVITGEIGTGKTTVLNAALRQLGPQYVTARLVHTTLSDVELLQALLSEFGKPNYGTKKVKLLDMLRAHFLEQHIAGRHIVIIVDEAQHLSASALEELRLLSCIDTQDRRIVSIVLTGQPSLDRALDAEDLAQLRQRTRLRQRLRPMVEEETTEYIRHRLGVAGGNADETFEAEALREIHRLTRGIPRLINTLCDTALMACKLDSRRRVDRETIAGVLEELGWGGPDESAHARDDPAMLDVARLSGGQSASLSVYSSGKLLDKVELKTVPFSIGRGSGNDLVILQEEVTRRHALIELVNGHYVIEDLNSRNGVLINGQRREKATLVSGDIIGIGQITVAFHTVQAGTGRPPVTATGDETGMHGALISEARKI